MKSVTTTELNTKEAKAIAHALDIARTVVNMKEEDRPAGLKYLSSPEQIKALSYKFYSHQVTGATIVLTDIDE